MAFQLPALGYDYNALEPHIDARTMEIHHRKHHQGYVDKANAALEAYPEWLEKSPCEILTNINQVPEAVRTAVQNNVGGVCNHSFFWTILSPSGGGTPTGNLSEAINTTFGSFENFQAEFKKASLGQFGSGWAWLVMKDGVLSIIATANQDSVLTLGYKRILGIDVWEHAYYLNYQNRRPDYVDAFWNIVDWNKCEEYFQKGGI
ncbi:superoxide dismutase [Candidatus Gracilibacteria bacterium]|nr:superoxide dismutase [Candidatus Gracilibacteria bacterium]